MTNPELAISAVNTAVGVSGVPRERQATTGRLALRAEDTFGFVDIQRDEDRCDRRHHDHTHSGNHSRAERSARRLVCRLLPSGRRRQEGCSEAEPFEHVDHRSARLAHGHTNIGVATCFRRLDHRHQKGEGSDYDHDERQCPRQLLGLLSQRMDCGTAEREGQRQQDREGAVSHATTVSGWSNITTAPNLKSAELSEVRLPSAFKEIRNARSMGAAK